MIIWKGHGILVGVAAAVGGISGLLLGMLVDSGRASLVLAGLGSAALAWLYVRTIGRTTTREYVDPRTGQPVLLKSAHTLYFIPVSVWAWIISAGGLLLVIAAIFIDPSKAGGGHTAEERERIAATASGAEALEASDALVATLGSTAVHGNTEAALRLAGRFSRGLADLRSVGVEKRKKPSSVSLSGGQFLTYCHVAEGTCAFITHVPDLRKFTDDAKEFIRQAAWMQAVECARGLEPKPQRLAVGLRGAVLYDAVLIGELPATGGGEDAGLKARHLGASSKDKLIPFFNAAPTTGAPAPAPPGTAADAKAAE